MRGAHFHALVRRSAPILPLPRAGDSASVRADLGPHALGSPPACRTRRFAALPKDRVLWPPPARSSPARSARWRSPLASWPHPDRARARRIPIRSSPAPMASISARAISRSPRTKSAPACRRMRARPEARIPHHLSRRRHRPVAGRRAAEARRPRRRQAPHRVRAQQGADGNAAAGRRPGRRRPTTRCTRSTTTPSSRCRPNKKCTRATSWSPTEDEAKAIEAELKKGADFATLAKEKSKDPGAADGGDLGYFTKDQMVPEFAEVAFKLDKGQISDPVKTQFGWHIIKVEDKRTKPTPTFDEVKGQLETYVAHRAQADLVAEAAQRRQYRAARPAAGRGRRSLGAQSGRAGEEVTNPRFSLMPGACRRASTSLKRSGVQDVDGRHSERSTAVTIPGH